ncbi:MAG: AraC family transcriptional regulator [Oscillospiraceae bacterium]
MNRTAGQENLFDMHIAREMVDAFVCSTGVSCLLTDAEGRELYRREPGYELYAQCCKVMGDQACKQIHLYGACESERFGGRYFYFCPMGMGCFAAPIILEGRRAGALVAGPVRVMDPEDHLASTPALQCLSGKEKAEEVTELLQKFPQREPGDLNHMAALLLSVALYIGGERRSLLERRQTQEQHRDIGEYMQQLKLDGVQAAYPLDKEQALIRAITEGDQSEARRLLNELLGHIFFSTGGDFAIMRARSLELMALLSRAAADGGADLEQVLALNQRFLKESDYLRSTDELTVWLTRVIERYVALVFDLVDVKHKDIIYKAINYMKRNFTGKLTLEDTARHVGFSPTYFSKVFKDEMGTTFNNYLGNLRVERSKMLLLSGELSVGEVCTAVGFEDQSYFIKVFRRYTGVTPGKFRKQQGRLDSKKEHGFVEK